MLQPFQETVNGHTFSLLPIAGGTFLMGSAEDDPQAYADEKPQHTVTVPDFYLGVFPVTQALWRAVVTAALDPASNLEPNPSYFPDDDRPVEKVSWDDVQIFLEQLNALTAHTRPVNHFFRLPSEAEWEYAARGGPYQEDGFQFVGSDRLKVVGWFDDNSNGETKPVGLKNPNPLGLYDMSGNVWEWCADDWHDNFQGAPEMGQPWIDRPDRGTYRMLRGGSWYGAAQYCRAACRAYNAPDDRWNFSGFRLAFSLQSAGSPVPAFL